MHAEIRRSRLLAVLLLAVVGAMAQAATAQDPGDSTSPDACHEEGKDGLCGHAAAQILRLQNERLASPESDEVAAKSDFLHCKLEIAIDPVAKLVTGSNTINVVAQVDGLDQLALDFRSNMTVDSVMVNDKLAVYTRPTHQILITLDRTYDTGEAFVVSVAYHGKPETMGWGSFSFATHGDPAVSIVSTLSEPWGAHTWWPCKEYLPDKFTADIWVTVPDWMIVASNGSLQGTDTLSGNRKRYRWQEGHPIDVYLVSIAATNYTTWTDTYTYADGSMPVEFYIYPESVAGAQAELAKVVTMISTFSRPDVYGQYPFVDEKYGIAQFQWQGGMEHQTITSQGILTSEWLTAHELSHQWWGDLITCKTWHDIWLNEGFATHSEAVWQEKKPSGSMAAYRSRMSARRPSESSFGGTVYCYDISSADRVFSSDLSYKKGAWVMHMLRHVIGDTAFFDTLAVYRAAYAHGAADTEDFRRIAETVSGRDLGWFFEEWVYGGGAPYYSYGWKQAQIGSQKWVWLHVDQYQGSLYSYPNFAMPIDITLTTAAGTETRVIWHEADREWYLLPVSGTVTSLKFDKDTWILRGAANSVSYIDGPPKLIRTVPEPGAAFDSLTNISAVQIQFSEPIACTAADFTVTGSRTGAQSFSQSYSSSDYVVTLTFGQPLAGEQTWTVRVADTLSSQAAGAALDGEMVSASSPASLPSGDGIPGGDAVFTFLLAVAGDFDLDADVDSDDLCVFETCFTGPAVAGPPPGGCTQTQFQISDYDHDQDVDMDDFGAIQRHYGERMAPAGSPISSSM